MCQNMQLKVDKCALQSMLQDQHLHLSRHAYNIGDVQGTQHVASHVSNGIGDEEGRNLLVALFY